MYAQKENPKENKSRAVADEISQKQSGSKSAFQFVDNRPEAIGQRMLQGIPNDNCIQMMRIGDEPIKNQLQGAVVQENMLSMRNNSTKITQLRAYQLVADQRGMALQFAGNYTGKMPKHEATNAPKYNYRESTNEEMTEKNEYTYHHIIPENFIQQVYDKVKVTLGTLDKNSEVQENKEAALAQEAFHTKGIGWWQKVRAKNTTHDINHCLSTAPYTIKVSESDVLQVIMSTENNLITRYDALLNLIKAEVKKKMVPEIKKLVKKVTQYSSSDPSVIHLNNVIRAFLPEISMIVISNSASYAPGRKTLRTQTANYRQVVLREVNMDRAYEGYVRRYFVNGNFVGKTGLKRVVQMSALDNTDSMGEQVEEMMLWIPGNIHQGPKSTYRLQGDQTYKTDDIQRNEPDGYNAEQDDGGGNFERSAQHVVGGTDQHFTILENLKGILEDLDAGPNQLDKIKAMFEAMTSLYDEGLTYFMDTAQKWGFEDNVIDGDKGAMRIRS